MKYFLQLILTAFLVFSIKAQVNLASGLTACYALDGNAIEPINASTGSFSSISATINRFGNISKSISFAGNSGSYAELPDNAFLKPADAISFSCWIKTPSLIDQYIVFTKNSLNSFFEAYELCIDPTLHFMTRKSGPNGLNMVVSTSTLLPDTWFHLVFTIDNFFVKLYVNGQLEGSTPSTFNGFDYVTGNRVYLGSTNDLNYDAPFSGSMDNVRFYNRTLNATEVNALYNQDPICLLKETTQIDDAKIEGDLVRINQNFLMTELKINNNTNKPIEYQLLDLNGRIIEKGILNDEKVINMAAYKSGVYLLHILTQNPTITKKIIKA